MDGETSSLKSEDIILINSNTIHDIEAKDAVMIALQMKQDVFTPLHTDIENLVFDCNSSKDSDKTRYSGIQFAISKMIKENSIEVREQITKTFP
jgi:xylan 1,4-beta-xylosidase